MRNTKNILKVITNNIFPILTLVISLLALFSSFKACDISQDANEVAKDSVNQAIRANEISLGSNEISKNANEITKKALSESSIKANEANIISKKSNEISEKSLLQSETALKEAKKFAEINGQVMWNSLKEAYDNSDREVLEWEQANNLKRVEKPVNSIEELLNFLGKIKISDEGKRLYIIRFDKRISLIKASEAYEPFKERLSNLDFTLPAPPLLPKFLLSESGKMILDEKGRPILLK